MIGHREILLQDVQKQEWLSVLEKQAYPDKEMAHGSNVVHKIPKFPNRETKKVMTCPGARRRGAVPDVCRGGVALPVCWNVDHDADINFHGFMD
jgi:hypothetical protein